MNGTIKKLLSVLLCLALVLSLVPAFGLTASAAGPTVIYSTSFETADVLDEWYALDEDGDGLCWDLFENDGEEKVVPDGKYCMVSYSYDNYTDCPRWPDNWLISPEITIPAAGKTELNYTVFSVDPNWPGEMYHVYVIDGEDMTHIWSEDLKVGQDRNTPLHQTLDLSAYGGKTVQIAFRHYGTSDIFAIGLDSVSVTNLLETMPETIDIELKAPMVDAVPTETVMLPAGSSLTSISWEPADAVFQPGKSYTVRLDLAAVSGTVFHAGQQVTINGQKATVLSASADVIRVAYTFPALEAAYPGIKTTYEPASVFCEVGDAVTLSVKTDLDLELTDNLSVQWYRSGSETYGSGEPILGETSFTLTADTSAMGTSYYYCVVKGRFLGEELTSEGVGAPVVSVTVSGKGLPFVDVPEGVYFYDAVDWAVSEGITTGSSTTTFDPNGTCTRGQAVTFLWRAMGCPKPKSTTVPFTDVQPGAYYYNAVLWALENDITQGTGSNTFSPNAPCTRGQIVTFLWRSYGKVTVTGENPFTDVAAGEYYYMPVLWAVRNNIAMGTGTTTFSPGTNCTRAQIVTFLYRAAYA